MAARKALKAGKKLDLTDVEFGLLEALMRVPGTVLSRDEAVSRSSPKVARAAATASIRRRAAAGAPHGRGGPMRRRPSMSDDRCCWVITLFGVRRWNAMPALYLRGRFAKAWNRRQNRPLIVLLQVIAGAYPALPMIH